MSMAMQNAGLYLHCQEISVHMGIADNGIHKKLRAGEYTLWCADDDGTKIAAGLVDIMHALLVYLLLAYKIKSIIR